MGHLFHTIRGEYIIINLLNHFKNKLVMILKYPIHSYQDL